MLNGIWMAMIVLAFVGAVCTGRWTALSAAAADGARQAVETVLLLLGAMCLNKTAILPPDFCLMQTAHDPGSVRTADGIDARITEFAARIAKIQTVQK